MNFLISNFNFNGSSRFGNLYYLGNCIKIDKKKLKVRKSSDWRFFETYAQKLDDSDINEPIDSDDFFFCLDYNAELDEMIYQTDIIGYESAYYYIKDDIFAISDDFLELALTIKNNTKVEIQINEKKAREFLAFSEPIFDETYIDDIFRMKPATIFKYFFHKNTCIEVTYDDFIMTRKIETVDVAAKRLYNILDEYFKDHYVYGPRYTIGMSGGLDSRVGAYFAKKNKYEINPIFIGRKKNIIGIITNDCKRAEEVNFHLGFEKIKYLDPRTIEIEDKVCFEAVHAPLMVDNIAQNMRKQNDVICLINGIIGGEALGALIPSNMQEMGNEELANYMLYRLSNIPKYKSRLSRRISQLTHNKILNNCLKFKQDWIYRVISLEEQRDVLNRVINWVESQKQLGLDNINIYHKFFYYRFAVANKNAYYATFNNTVPSICTYLNPKFIREMLSWKSEFLINKQVQKNLLIMLEGLSSIRSQTTEVAIDGYNKDSKIKRAIRIVERVIRGGGMVYTQWYSPKSIKKELNKRRDKASLLRDLVIDKHWYKADYHFAFGFMKLLRVEQILEAK